jgi:hypothetical protein
MMNSTDNAESSCTGRERTRIPPAARRFRRADRGRTRAMPPPAAIRIGPGSAYPPRIDYAVCESAGVAAEEHPVRGYSGKEIA